MRHFMAQFGPCLSWPWTKLMDVPEFNDELVDLIASQSDAQSGAHGRSANWSASATTISSPSCRRWPKENKGKGWGAGELHKAYVKQLGKGGEAKLSKAAAKAKAARRPQEEEMA